MPILRPGRHRVRSSRRRLVVLGAFAVGVLLLGSAAVAYRLGIVENPFAERGRPPERLIEGDTPDVPPPRGVDADLGFPWAADGPGGPINTVIAGLTTFRGNAARSYYGEGPVPSDPVVLWRYPGGRNLCMESTDLDETKIWCGMGWTGQPTVVEVEGGGTEVRFGAYDGRYHFLDGATGRPMRPDLITGDLAKGSATIDPDGFPLYYAGSRDNYLRVVALDRETPTVLWSLDAATSVPEPRWNDDWDGASLVLGDHLLVGGENSWFYVIRLNRAFDGDGLVTVDPQVVATMPAFDDRLLESLDDPDPRTSIEASVSYFDGVAYVANSAGLVLGFDVSDVLRGGDRIRQVFRFWTGDDTDATVVIDDEGFLYVASVLERFNERAAEVGQLMKLDPRNPDDPIVWSIAVTERGDDGNGGLFSTPAIDGAYLYAATNAGSLFAVRRDDGRIVWRTTLAEPTWSSPVVVDGVLIQGDCEGVLHGFNVSRPQAIGRVPEEMWTVQLEGCVEATPAVWEDRIYVGTREGGIYAIGDRA